MSQIARAAASSLSHTMTAMEEASREGRHDADIEHLFLALVLDEGPAGQALRGLGITLGAARSAVAAQHAAQLESVGITAVPTGPGRIVFHESQGYEWTDRAIRVLRRSDVSGSASTLRALLAEPSGMIAAILERLDVRADEITARLDETATRPPHPTSKDPLSSDTTVFVPAPLDEVWRLVSDPLRMAEWYDAVGSVSSTPDAADHGWTAIARTQTPGGTPVRVKPPLRRLEIQPVARHDGDLVSWRITTPDSPRANTRLISLSLEPAAEGTHVGVAFAWQPRTRRRRIPGLRLLMRPLVRFALWAQVTQVGAGISRAFRD